jgi:hypothetical protein
VLRDKKILLAKDVPELKEFICDVPGEILQRLENGQSGLGECAQGFQLSNGYKFYPNCTSRNVNVAAFLDDMFLPITVVGNVILNLRTYPIRIASKKYISTAKFIDTKMDSHELSRLKLKHANTTDWMLELAAIFNIDPKLVIDVVELESGKSYIKVTHIGQHLTNAEKTSLLYEYEERDSYSGDGYDDQKEITWEQIEEQYGKEIPQEVKLTSLTKLMRRVFTFSQQNLEEAIIHNQTPHSVFLSLNFVNWIDGTMEGITQIDSISEPTWDWIAENIVPIEKKFKNVKLRYLGTGRYTEETIELIYED